MWDPDERVREAFGGRDVRTTLLDRLPGSGSLYRWLLPTMPAAFRRLDLSGFDVVISSSHALCKSVRAAPDALHLCYCHTPPRYLWELASFHNRGLAGLLRMPVVRALRRSDLRAAAGVDRFIANSECVRDRIRRTYGRDATVVYPPVEVERFAAAGARIADGAGRKAAADSAGVDGGSPAAPASRDYYLAGGRLVPYKELDVVVEAANRARLPLKLFGDGPEKPRLERMAGPTVEILGRVSDAELAGLLAGCRGFLFPGIEDFGILPVEAQAAGSPVVARRVGGALETVRDGKTGVLYDGSGVQGLLAGIERLEGLSVDSGACRRNAGRFGPDVFARDVESFVREAVQAAGMKAE